MSLRACDVCSSVKQKCDGAVPCGRCQRLGIPCGQSRLSGFASSTGKHRAITIRRERTGCSNCKRRKKKCHREPQHAGAGPCSDCSRLNLRCDLGNRPATSKTQDDVSSPAVFEQPPTPRDERRRAGRSSDAPEEPPPAQDNATWQDNNLYSWLDAAVIPSSNSSENGSFWNGEEDPMASMASIALDIASMEDLLEPGGLYAVPEPPSKDSESPAVQQQQEEKHAASSWWLAEQAGAWSKVPQFTFTGTALDQLSDRQDRYLLHHYSHVVARSLCIMSPQDSNPFLRMMLPLAAESPAVMGAVLSLSACHLQQIGGPSSSYSEICLGHQTRALSALNELLDGSKSNAGNNDLFDTHLLALAAILLFCIADIRQGHSTNWVWHIVAAKNMIAGRPRRASKFSPWSDPWPFLLDLFEYVDSIITVSKCKPPLFDDHQKAQDDACSGTTRQNAVNPIFGVARPLMRFVGQVSALSNRRKYRVNAAFDAKFRQSAALLGQTIRAWEPAYRLPTVVMSVQDIDLSAAIHCAQAIKYASILRLHQVVDGYRLPNPTSTECLGRILSHVRQIPIGCPAESSLVFPLFMAGAVSLEEEDRMTVLHRWAIIERTIGFGNVAKGRMVLEKVWSTMDEDLASAKALGQEQCSNVNWARIRWFEFSELVLF